MDNNRKELILKEYLDKCFISAILCDNHYQYYYKINMISMMPLILGSSILTVLNSSSLKEEIMKYVNVSVNGLNTLIIALTTQYKLQDRINTYKTLYNKFQKLSHKIESIINNTEIITDKILDDIITEYDILQNDNQYTYLSFYKTKIIKAYVGKRTMPNSLSLEAELVIINT